MSKSKDTPEAKALDEDLHSRQMAVYGRESMMKLSQARILVSGLNGLGAEVAKNVILANVKSVTLHDEKAATLSDLGSNFYLTEASVGKNRAEASKTAFQELNPTVEIATLTGPLTPALVKGFSVLVLCDSTLDVAEKIDKAAREQKACFIWATCHGVFGSVFCDFGAGFVCQDTTGEAVKTAIIRHIEKSAPGKQALVQCVLDNDIDLDDGDSVVFSEVKGMVQLNDGKPRQVHDVSKGKKTFKIDDTSAFSPYEEAGIATQKKIPVTMHFRSLTECLADPGTLSDWDTSKQSEKAKNFDESVLAFFGKPEFEQKFGRSGLLLLALRSLYKVGAAAARAEGGAEKLIAAARELNAALGDRKVEELEGDRCKTLEQVARGAGCVLNPMAAIFGGVVGQEVIKACTGKFNPTFQWMLFDAEEALPATATRASPGAVANSRYADQIAVLGPEMQEKLAKLNVFLVGSGALGCELLKNLALMGCCSAVTGQLTVTDDDIIEKSNLSRQFLFRNHNIGQSKSESASKAAQVMNPQFKVKALTERVQPATENIFDEVFWDKLDVVINALDNVKARLYVDSKCVVFGKPLLESGTLGPKCNTQVVVPHMTENYGATRDPPEKEAPQCALHNFPHNIDHCLGLAKSEFIGNFETVPQDANDFTKDPTAWVQAQLTAGENPASVLDKLIGDPKFNCGMAGGLMDALVKEHPANFEQCVGWARRKYQSYFVDRIELLTYNCPQDMKTEAGTSFWSPPKRFPSLVPFDADDETAMKFIIAASNLRAKLYGFPDEHRDVEYFKKVLNDVKVPVFKPFKTKVKTEEDEGNETTDMAGTEMTDDVARLEAARNEIAGVASKQAKKAYFVNEFEKDQDDNFHIDFIQAFANLRARNYDIGEIDFLQTKLKAGRIIPAIATATAMATGLVCLELLKVLDKKPLEGYRNTFANLALPLYSQSEPAKCDQVKSGTRFDPDMYMDVDEVAVPDPQTIWDTMIIKCSRSATIQSIVDWFKKEKKLDLNGWIFTSADGKADSSPLSGRAGLKLLDYFESNGFSCAGKRKLELGDSPPNARVLELTTADGDDVKICRVIAEFTD
ncbi:Ubiquitin-activating enzyme E1 2 [Diplonema papillatum]|nr:Ubiquitin-activating enzyme E1 2 [Diplonema papillatum]